MPDVELQTGHERRARPTLRCLVEDLTIELPPEEFDLGAIDHVMMDEARRLAPTSPAGQRRILSIDHPPIYRCRHSIWRGATWVDAENGIVWLLAAAKREDGSRGDAYEHFETLFRTGRLLPSGDDRLRDRVERAARLISKVRSEAGTHLATALAEPGTEHRILLADALEIRLYTSRDDVTEIWLAVCIHFADGQRVNPRLIEVIFATFEAAAGSSEWEPRADWPVGELRWFERARLGIAES